MSCLFCEIIKGNIPSHKVWESDTHLAFLSIFPNTKGFTVVVTKEHYPSYAFALPDPVLTDLVLAAKQVAQRLDSKFEDVGRTGLIFEGFGVDHAHCKLIPMHGTANMAEFKPLNAAKPQYFEQYEGYISSHDYQRADDTELAELAAYLRS